MAQCQCQSSLTETVDQLTVLLYLFHVPMSRTQQHYQGVISVRHRTGDNFMACLPNARTNNRLFVALFFGRGRDIVADQTH